LRMFFVQLRIAVVVSRVTFSVFKKSGKCLIIMLIVARNTSNTLPLHQIGLQSLAVSIRSTSQNDACARARQHFRSA